MSSAEVKEFKAEDVALIGLDAECDCQDPCKHDCFVLLKSKAAYKTSLDQFAIKYLVEAGVTIHPWNESWMFKHFLQYEEDNEPTVCIRLSEDRRLRRHVDPNDDDAIGQHVTDWPCKAKDRKDLAEARRKVKSYESKIEQLKQRVKELEAKLK
jgi:hypothetical protein